jgi:hypothetical protein
MLCVHKISTLFNDMRKNQHSILSASNPEPLSPDPRKTISYPFRDFNDILITRI